MNLEFVKVEDKTIIESLELIDSSKDGDIYLLKENGEVVGYGIIYNADDKDKNKIDLYVVSNKRGNGYGKYLFNRLIEELKRRKYSEIALYINNANIVQRRLVSGVGGIQISCDRGIGKYVIPLGY